MPRFIMIDSDSGYVFGDTADLNGKLVPCSNPVEACHAMDHAVGEYRRTYREHGPDSHAARRGASGYFVYTAREGQRYPFIHDGQDKADIAAVQRNLTLVAFVETVRPSEVDLD